MGWKEGKAKANATYGAERGLSRQATATAPTILIPDGEQDNLNNPQMRKAKPGTKTAKSPYARIFA